MSVLLGRQCVSLTGPTACQSYWAHSVSVLQGPQRVSLTGPRGKLYHVSGQGVEAALTASLAGTVRNISTSSAGEHQYVVS